MTTIRIPFILISIEADKIINTITSVNSNSVWNTYLALLEGTGWSDKSYDEETLKHIDTSWETTYVWN